jgi:hypothetical protein
VASAVRTLADDPRAAVERLANGNSLMKTLTVAHRADGVPAACYTWALACERSGGAVVVARFSTDVALAAAGDVITQSDLALLDRQVRAASFTSAPSSG